MEKIKLYIRRGKGIGLLFLLASAVLATMFLMISLKSAYTEIKPEVVLVANEFLPITVKGGKIVEPANAYKRIELDFGGKGEKKDLFPVVLDTRNEVSSVPTEPQGLFITTDTVYAVTAEFADAAGRCFDQGKFCRNNGRSCWLRFFFCSYDFSGDVLLDAALENMAGGTSRPGCS